MKKFTENSLKSVINLKPVGLFGSRRGVFSSFSERVASFNSQNQSLNEHDVQNKAPISFQQSISLTSYVSRCEKDIHKYSSISINSSINTARVPINTFRVPINTFRVPINTAKYSFYISEKRGVSYR